MDSRGCKRFPSIAGKSTFNPIRAVPDTPHYEHQLAVAEGDFVIVHGRFSGPGRMTGATDFAWVAADIVRIEDGWLAEHWDVLQGDATAAGPKSGLPGVQKGLPQP